MSVPTRAPICPCCGQALPSLDAELEARISFVAGWAGQTAANIVRALYEQPVTPQLPALTSIPHLDRGDIGWGADHDVLNAWHRAAKRALERGEIDIADRLLAVVQRGVELSNLLYPDEEAHTLRNFADLWIDLGEIAEKRVDVAEAIRCYRRGLEWANKSRRNNNRRNLLACLERLGVKEE